MVINEEFDNIPFKRASTLAIDLDRMVLGFYGTGEINAYHLWSKDFLVTYKGHTDSILCLVISDDILLSTSKDQLWVHDLVTTLQMGRIWLEFAQIAKAIPSSDCFLVGLKSGELIKMVKETGQVKSVSSTSLCLKFASGSRTSLFWGFRRNTFQRTGLDSFLAISVDWTRNRETMRDKIPRMSLSRIVRPLLS